MESKSKKIYVGKSKINGKGIFAAKNIKKGEVVDHIKGKVVSWFVKDKKSALVGPNWIGLNKNHWIDPKPPFDHINHSCDPNVGIKGKCRVVALKSIKKDEEIMIDYSITESDLLWEMKCSCGSKNCRNKIKSIHSLSKSTVKKYLPYIPSFFKKVYYKHKNKKNGK